MPQFPATATEPVELPKQITFNWPVIAADKAEAGSVMVAGTDVAVQPPASVIVTV